MGLMRRAILLCVLWVMSGCEGDSKVGRDNGGSPSVQPSGDVASAPPGVSPDPSETSFAVTYERSMLGSPLMRFLGAIGPNDFYKFSRAWANVSVVAPFGSDVLSLTVTIDDREPLTAVGRFRAELPLRDLEEGIHTIRYSAHLDTGDVVHAEEEFRVLFNTTALAAGGGSQVWVGTVDFGLLAYDLGVDALDRSDDVATPLWLNEPAPSDVAGSGLDVFLWGVLSDANSVLSLLPDGERGLWIGWFGGGLIYLDHGGTPHDAKDDHSFRFIPPVCGYEPDYPCAGDRVGSGREHSSPYAVFGGVALGGSVTAIADDGDGGLWIGTLNGLLHLDYDGTPHFSDDDTWTTFPSEGLYDATVSQLQVDSDGRVWLASFDLTDEDGDRDGLVLLDPAGTPSDRSDDHWGRFEDLTDAMSSQVYALAIDDDGLKWLGTSGGLWVLDDAGSPLDPSDDVFAVRSEGLPDDDVRAVLPRADGTVLVGAFDLCAGDGGGLSLLELGGKAPPAAGPDGRDGMERLTAALRPELDLVLATWTVEDGLLDDDVSSVIELAGGKFLVGTFNFLAAPAIRLLLGEDDGLPECGSPDGPRRSIPTPAAMVGKDGLSVIDPGLDLRSDYDDYLTNL